MLHRRPGTDCPLCPLWGIPWDDHDPASWGKQHVHAEALWDDWAPSDKSGRWIANVIDTANDLGVEVTPEQVKAHFSDRHKIEQPMMTGSLNHEHLLSLANGFSDEGQAVINAIYRQHVLMTRQIVDVFYGRGRSLNAARQAALGELSPLAQAHFLYRYYPSDEDAKRKNPPPQFSKSAIWYLGRAAIPYIKERYGLNFYPPHITRARDVKTETMIHDLKANGIFSSICAALNEAKGKIPYQDGDILLEALPANWYGPGPQALNMAFLDRQTSQERRIMPDGFASLSVHRSGDISNCQLPFFYEFDNGTRDPKDVAGQLLAYHLLALSGVATRRFSDLDVDQYALPVLMVFSDKGRAKKVSRLFREKAQTELGIENGAPIFIANEKDWNTDPFAADVVRQAWEENASGHSFLDLLVNASRPLIEAKKVSADQVLQLDTTVGNASTGMQPSGEKTRPKSPVQIGSQPPVTASGDPQVSANDQSLSDPSIDDRSGSKDDMGSETDISSAMENLISPQTIDEEQNVSQTVSQTVENDQKESFDGLLDADQVSLEQSDKLTQQALPAVSSTRTTQESPERLAEYLALEIVAARQHLQQLEERQRELLGHEEAIEPEPPFALPAGAISEAEPILQSTETEAPQLMPPSDPSDPFSAESAYTPPPETVPPIQAPPTPQPPPAVQPPSVPEPVEPRPVPAETASSVSQEPADQNYTPAWEELEDQPQQEQQPQPIMPSQPAPMPEQPAATEIAPPPAASFPSLEDEMGWEEATPDSPPPPLPLPDAFPTDEQDTPARQADPVAGTDDAPLIPDYQHAPPVDENDPLQQQSLQSLPEMPAAPEPTSPLAFDEEAMLPADSPLRTTRPEAAGELPHVAGPALSQELPPLPTSAIPSEPIPPAYASVPDTERQHDAPPLQPASPQEPEDDPLADLPPLPGPGDQSIFSDDAGTDQVGDPPAPGYSQEQQEIVNPLPVSAEPIQEADTVPVGTVEDRLNSTAAARRAKRARRNKS